MQWVSLAVLLSGVLRVGAGGDMSSLQLWEVLGKEEDELGSVKIAR